MANDRPDQNVELDLGAGNDPSSRLLADAMPAFKRCVAVSELGVAARNQSQSEGMESVMKDMEMRGFKPWDMKTPAGERQILIEWGEVSIKDLLKDFKLEPTAEEKANVKEDAQKHLEGNDLYKLLPKTDQQALTKMQEAILNGDTKALAELVKQYKGDPDKLEALGHVIEKNLKEMGASVQVDITDAGKLLVYDRHGRQAVEIAADGKVTVRSIQVNIDGSVEVLEGRQVLRPKAAEVAKGIADGAVYDAAHPRDYSTDFPPIGFPPGGSPSGGFPPGGSPPIVPGEPRIPLYRKSQL